MREQSNELEFVEVGGKKCFKSFRVEPAICKLLATSQTHHFSRRLFSYTCQLTLSPPFASTRRKYIIDKNPEAIILCRITPRNVCIYTSVEDTKWMGICEERDWNQINRSKCFFFISSCCCFFPANCDWKMSERMDGWRICDGVLTANIWRSL